MIFAALLTSVGINDVLILLFVILYSILRNRPSNAALYTPRLAAEGKSQEEDDSSVGGEPRLAAEGKSQEDDDSSVGRLLSYVEPLLSYVEWVKGAWQPSEADLLSKSGLDAVVFMRIFIFGLRVFLFATIVGISVLLPFNYMGNQLNIDLTGLPSKSLETFSISNVGDGSKRLWIHFSAVYLFTAVVCYLLYYEYDYISSKRIACFHSSKPQPGQFTVLVRNIPGRNFSESVESFFRKHYPSTYVTHSVVRRASKRQRHINEADKVFKILFHWKSQKHPEERSERAGCMGLFNKHEDRSSVAGKELRAAFVYFKSRFTAAIVSQLQQRVKPTEWLTEQAPDPQDVYWPFFSTSFIKRWMCNIAVIFACFFITVLFLVPVLLVQGLTHLDQLETWLPFLRGILSLKIVSQVVTGYLPSLILEMFLSLVPPVMIVLSSIQGYIALSQIEKSACIKVLWFTIWNIFFANVLSGSVLYRVDVFLELKRIPELLAVAVPGQASFFIAYVVTSGWTNMFHSELFQLKRLIWRLLKRSLCWKLDEELKPPSSPYHSEIPRILFFSLLGITYLILAPLILPFLLVYYCFGYIIYRNQLLYVYAPKFETGGKFWPVVHDTIIFSLILMHVIAIGIFGLKKVRLASSLTIPLPIVTLIFNSYCRRRFLPSFKGYPAECLMRKDEVDPVDHTSFYDKLSTAYQDPAMDPIRYSESSESSNSFSALIREESEVFLP